MGGISSIISALGLLGGLLFLAGIALVVVSVSQGRPARGGILLSIFGLIAFVLLQIVGQGLLEVGPTQVAVVFNRISGQFESPKGPGIHIVIPGIQSATIYPTSQQNYTMSGTNEDSLRGTGDDAVVARSVDGQEVKIDVTVIFAIDPVKVNDVHRQWSDTPGGYTESLIRPRIRSDVRDVISGYQAEQIYGLERETVQSQIEERLSRNLEPFGFNVTSVLVREITFSPLFTEAIENKVIEEQRLQRARTEAERVAQEARGQANAAIERARGEADAILIRAQADAEALRLVSEQIAANPNLVQYLYVQNLADNVRLAILPSNTPFFIDPTSLIDLGDDFRAPAVPEPAPVRVPEEEGGSGN